MAQSKTQEIYVWKKKTDVVTETLETHTARNWSPRRRVRSNEKVEHKFLNFMDKKAFWRTLDFDGHS